MTKLSDKHIQELKDLMEEKGGKEVSWDEASDAGYRLVGLVELVLKHQWEEDGWKRRLETEPRGFKLQGNGRNCAVCGNSTTEDTNWYDKWGIKCLTCQKAIDKKQIPGSIAKTNENRYSSYDLQSRFGLKTPTLRSWVKKGIIKARIIYSDSGRPYHYLYLIKDNKDFLPPKKMTEPKMVAEEKDDKTWHHLEPWYRFVNPYEHLAGYKIMDYLQFVEKQSNS